MVDIFSQICDGNGIMVHWKFNEYLQEVLALPAAVYESPTFPFTSQLANDIFPTVSMLQSGVVFCPVNKNDLFFFLFRIPELL